MYGLKSAVLFLLLIGGLGLNATARAQDDDEEELLIIIEDDEEEGVAEQTPPPSDIGHGRQHFVSNQNSPRRFWGGPMRWPWVL